MERGGNPAAKRLMSLKRRFVEEPYFGSRRLHAPVTRWSPTLQILRQEPYYQCLCEDEKWHPCAFLSKGLNDVEEEIMMCMIKKCWGSYEHWRRGRDISGGGKA